MTNLDVVYAAGLIDGEGCFSITSITTGVQTQLRVSMTSKAVIEWLHAVFGGAVHKNSREGTRENTYTWQLNKRSDVCELTEALLPYLKVKRLPAIIMLEFCGKFPVMQKGLAYSNEKFEEMRKYSDFMAIANGKGPGSEARKEAFLKIVEGGC